MERSASGSAKGWRMCGNNNGRKITRHSNDYLGQSKRRLGTLQVFHFHTRDTASKKMEEEEEVNKKLEIKCQNCLHRCQFELENNTNNVHFIH